MIPPCGPEYQKQVNILAGQSGSDIRPLELPNGAKADACI
jgi:hypothetical protein